MLAKAFSKTQVLAALLALLSWAGVVAVPGRFPPTPKSVGLTAEFFFFAVTFTSAFFEGLFLDEKWYVHLRRSVWVAIAFSTIFAGLISQSIPWKLLGVWAIAVILFEAALSVGE